jgi:hypothetical protein
MATRSAKGSHALADLVRERQDLVGEWQAKDRQLIAAKSEPPDNRKGDAEKALADRLGVIDTRLAEIDRRFKQDFPDYAALASPTPLSVTDVQTQLAADEALILFLDTEDPLKPAPEETFVWVVTAQATEREIKRLSASGELAEYRMLHFATHGLLSGQLDGTHEPGLILTPPDKATEEDDGYLSASEIAALKLDADWVILSACNTAAGAATSAEALSGLARAFIYAQARALLVSHWEVYSDATVKLITTAIREMARDPKVGRAEALRRSMLALIDKGEPNEAHPAYWAPFVVVGEGAAALAAR